MTEQERMKAFENQRRNAERRAKEADGTYDMERRIQYEKKQREERRLQQQRQALKQRVTAAVIVVAALQNSNTDPCAHKASRDRSKVLSAGIPLPCCKTYETACQLHRSVRP